MKKTLTMEDGKQAGVQHDQRSQSSFFIVFLTACFFGSLWGGWAFFSNRAHGFDIAVRALITQGSFSFILSFFFGMSVETLYRRSKTLWGKIVFSFLLPVSGLIVTVVTLHTIRGTPNIFLTIAPSISFAALYCVAKIVKGVLVTRRE